MIKELKTLGLDNLLFYEVIIFYKNLIFYKLSMLNL